MTGPKTFEEWKEAYEERDSDTDYELKPGERVVYDPMYGFFTYYFDAASKEILIPKMCGDGRFWRKQIYKLAKATRHLGVKGVFCCTKRNPVAYMRVIGGTLRRMEYTYDFTTGKSRILWFIFVSWRDTKEGRDEFDFSDSSDAIVDPAENLPCGGRGRGIVAGRDDETEERGANGSRKPVLFSSQLDDGRVYLAADGERTDSANDFRSCCITAAE
jgi:hypothetical protein